MVASHLDPSSGSNIANVISYLNSTNFTLGNGINLRSTSINDQVTVFRSNDVNPVVVDSSGSGGSGGSSSGDSNSAGLQAAKESVNIFFTDK